MSSTRQLDGVASAETGLVRHCTRRAVADGLAAGALAGLSLPLSHRDARCSFDPLCHRRAAGRYLGRRRSGGAGLDPARADTTGASGRHCRCPGGGRGVCWGATAPDAFGRFDPGLVRRRHLGCARRSARRDRGRGRAGRPALGRPVLVAPPRPPQGHLRTAAARGWGTGTLTPGRGDVSGWACSAASCRRRHGHAARLPDPTRGAAADTAPDTPSAHVGARRRRRGRHRAPHPRHDTTIGRPRQSRAATHSQDRKGITHD